MRLSNVPLRASSISFICPVRRLSCLTCRRRAGSCVAFSSSRSSSSGSIHSAPFSTVFLSDSSLSTTVHVQHPNLVPPHDGVLASTTSGHSAAFASLYMASRSRLLAPHGLLCCRR